MLEGLVVEYLVALEAEGRRVATRARHRRSLSQFEEWLLASELPTDPEQWTARLVREWMTHTRTRPSSRGGGPISPQSANSLFRSLRAFCHWLHREELMRDDVFRKIRISTPPRPVKPVLSARDVDPLVDCVRWFSRHPLRDEALILLALDTEARSGEVCSARLADVHWGRRFVVVTGRGSKQRVVPFSLETKQALRRDLRREHPPGRGAAVRGHGPRADYPQQHRPPLSRS